MAGLSSRMPVIDPRSVHVGSMVKKNGTGEVFLRNLRYYLVSIILTILHTYLPSTRHSYQKDKKTKHRELPKEIAFRTSGSVV